MPDANTKTISYPAAGIAVNAAFCRQQPRQIAGQPGGIQTNPVSQQPMLGGYDLQAQPDPNVWANTTPVGVNVRGYEPLSQRRRGGSRAGLSQYIPQQMNGQYLVQCLGQFVTEQS
jgi:hypothetical protein